jgi:ADP-ribosylation factor 2-binding protein
MDSIDTSSNKYASKEDEIFDKFVEQLQEIVIEDAFDQMQSEFMEKYYKQFEDKSENKLVYTDIFKKYTQVTEGYLESNLKKRLPQYKIEEFYKMLKSRKHKIDDQLLDTLLSLTDFQQFKEMMLEYKRMKSNHKDLFKGINIQGATSNVKKFDNFEELDNKFKKQKKK